MTTTDPTTRELAIEAPTTPATPAANAPAPVPPPKPKPTVYVQESRPLPDGHEIRARVTAARARGIKSPKR